MKFHRERHDSPDISLTPLIDVVFLLLIFFMVSTTFKHEAELEVDLPQASAETSEEPQKAIELIIDSKGRYFLGDQEVVNTRPETLKRALQEVAGEDRTRPLTIRADAQTPHQAVVTAMDVAGQLGFARLSIATVHAK